MEAKHFLKKNYHYAVIGSMYNPEKYGYRVAMDLHNAGLRVSGVHPKPGEVKGIQVFATLKDIPEKVDVAVFVVRPEIGLGILEQVKSLGIDKVWFQPGAESEEIRQCIAALGLHGMADGSCIMVARRIIGLHA